MNNQYVRTYDSIYTYVRWHKIILLLYLKTFSLFKNVIKTVKGHHIIYIYLYVWFKNSLIYAEKARATSWKGRGAQKCTVIFFIFHHSWLVIKYQVKCIKLIDTILYCNPFLKKAYPYWSIHTTQSLLLLDSLYTYSRNKSKKNPRDKRGNKKADKKKRKIKIK